MSVLLPLTLAAIMTTDPLGYECIPEARLEVAFALGGKGTRVPRTCIEDPCAETFGEVTLASYAGYNDPALYADYRHRMSMVCATPTVWDDKGIDREQLLWAVFDGGSGPIPTPDIEIAQNPVPAPLLLLGTAMAGLVAIRRRRR